MADAETRPDPEAPTVAAAGAGFRTTEWTRVLAARGRGPDSREALADLCAGYYSPVVAFLAREGRSTDAARDLAHAFFARLLDGDPFTQVDPERGRFRSYLLGALKHFLAHEREKEGRDKRRANRVPLRVEADDSARSIADLATDPSLTPDACFDRQWALAMLGRALATLRREAARRGADQATRFDRLLPWLTGESDYGEQSALAEELGTTTGALKVAVYRLRQQLRQAVRAEVARTLDNPSRVDEEMRALFAALG